MTQTNYRTRGKKVMKAIEKTEKKEKEKKTTLKDVFGKRSNQKQMKERIKKHSKLHKGGMNSIHIKNMERLIKSGKTFSEAHEQAVKLDKKAKM